MKDVRLVAALLCAFVALGCSDDDAERCGDGVRNGAEECDGADLGDAESCEAQGYYGGSLSCTDECTLDDSACIAAGRCGDGVLQEEAGEVCDGSAVASSGVGSCQELGYFDGEVACDSDCQQDLAGCVGVVRVAAGYGVSCALDETGQVWCWGGSAAGQVGAGDGPETCSVGGQDLPCSRNPVRVPGMTDVVDLQMATGTGLHVCALKSDGTIWCWGTNEFGQLGVSSTSDICIENLDWPCNRLPAQVEGMTNVTAIALGGPHTCALKDDGTVWCWGLNDYYQLGSGQRHETCTNGTYTSDCSHSPVQVVGLTDAVGISAGGLHSCAVRSGGELVCWGGNWVRQLGAPSDPEQDCPAHLPWRPQQDILGCSQNPVSATTLANVAYLPRGGLVHQCALDDEANLWCWGEDGAGQIGNGTDFELCPATSIGNIACQKQPGLVPGLSDVTVVSLGNQSTYALAAEGLVSWGLNSDGQLGNDSSGNMSNTPTPMAALSSVSDLAGGEDHACAVDEDRFVWCWGNTEVYALGFEWPSEVCPYPVKLIPATP